uniref:Uncharacterized protein n=1 Tax=Arundo donax TaxID=35708 RepID=A0A0A9EV18_ARUDO
MSSHALRYILCSLLNLLLHNACWNCSREFQINKSVLMLN